MQLMHSLEVPAQANCLTMEDRKALDKNQNLRKNK